MGFWSSKKKIKVYSQVANLAGAEKDQIKYLPSVIGMKVIGSNDLSMGDTIREALMNGQGMRTRAFGRWATTSNYRGKMGISSTRLFLGDSIDNGIIANQMPTPPDGSVINISTSYLGPADYAAWADQWMMDNHPSQIDADYEIDFNDAGTTIYIKFTDGVTPGYSFNPVGYDPTGQYLYVTYTEVARNSAGPVNPGTLIEIADPVNYPPVADWDSKGVNTYIATKTMNTIINTEVTYSDGRPSENSSVTVPRTEDFTEVDAQFEQLEFIGSNPAGTETNSLLRIMHRLQTQLTKVNTSVSTSSSTLPGGVTRTSKVTTLQEVLRPAFAYRIDTQIVTDRKWSNQKTFIYQYGTGNSALDAMFKPSTLNTLMYPFIPMKFQHIWVNERYYWDDPKGDKFISPLMKIAEPAYKKLTGQDFDKFLTKLAKQSGLTQANHMYLVLSVPINVKNNEGKKYLYYFFEILAENSGGSIGQYNAWRIKWNAADISQREWLAWKEGQNSPTNPYFGLPEPSRIPYPAAPGYTMRMTGSRVDYNMMLTWSAVQITEGTGLGWAEAKTGLVQVKRGLTEVFRELVYSGGIATWFSNSRDSVSITYQTGEDTWKMITVYNLVHINTVYKGKQVITTPGGFGSSTPSNVMIPLHEGIFKSMSLKDATQLCMSNSYAVINTYTEIKTGGWFDKVFMVLMVVVVVVITVVTAGGGAGSVGLLGPAAAVGTAIGFSGTLAVLAGTIANALAAMLLTRLITMGATALLGEKIGAIVGMVASIAAVSYGTSLQSGASFSIMDSFNNVETLMKLTLAAGKGYAEMITEDTRDVALKTQEMLRSYESDMEKYQNKWNEVLGNGTVLLDPMQMLGLNSQPSPFIPETPNSFLSRTLLTGSDIAEMTNSMITNFTDVSLSSNMPT